MLAFFRLFARTKNKLNIIRVTLFEEKSNMILKGIAKFHGVHNLLISY